MARPLLFSAICMNTASHILYSLRRRPDGGPIDFNSLDKPVTDLRTEGSQSLLRREPVVRDIGMLMAREAYEPRTLRRKICGHDRLSGTLPGAA
ncbi:MAG: hypothetical protein AB7Q81_21090 [Gammaproteobacteria bacterium]